MSIIYDFKAINQAASSISRHMLWPDLKFNAPKDMPPWQAFSAMAEPQRGALASCMGEIFCYDGSNWVIARPKGD